jgi:hypothetical protein
VKSYLAKTEIFAPDPRRISPSRGSIGKASAEDAFYILM